MQEQEHRIGVIAAVIAYLMWGVLPLYWKLLDHVSAVEVLAHRVVWSLAFMIIVLVVRKQLHAFWNEFKIIFSQKKTAISIILASLFISLNWFVFIWAVTNDRVVEASLGYYINPLINVLLAMVFLKERFTRWQGVSFALAFIGVSIMTIYYGVMPWVALILALSFSVYGLIKKVVNIGALFGLTIETFLIAPVALLFLLFSYSQNASNGIEMALDSLTLFLLIGAGAATAIPLLLFATGARRISLSLIGFLQYIGPTIMLFLGVFLYHEPFSLVQLIAFLFIWAGLFIFTFSRLSRFRKIFERLTTFYKPKEKSL